MRIRDCRHNLIGTGGSATTPRSQCSAAPRPRPAVGAGARTTKPRKSTPCGCLLCPSDSERPATLGDRTRGTPNAVDSTPGGELTRLFSVASEHFHHAGVFGDRGKCSGGASRSERKIFARIAASPESDLPPACPCRTRYRVTACGFDRIDLETGVRSVPIAIGRRR